MAKIRLTKSELKTQRDALKRFQRYLPTLQLKKQQLQLEVQRAREKLAQLRRELDEIEAAVQKWVLLLDSPDVAALPDLLRVQNWQVRIRNVAGIDAPVFEQIEFERGEFDLFATPAWFDDALDAARQLVELRLRRELLEEQRDLLEQELRIVTQRVNLFEKVKIPEARENIRRIQIYLGDQQTSAVGRAKLAKEKSQTRAL